MAIIIFGGSGPAITAHGSLDLKQENQIQIQIQSPSGRAAKYGRCNFGMRSMSESFIWSGGATSAVGEVGKGTQSWSSYNRTWFTGP
jgi:hypothetical protein